MGNRITVLDTWLIHIKPQAGSHGGARRVRETRQPDRTRWRDGPRRMGSVAQLRSRAFCTLRAHLRPPLCRQLLLTAVRTTRTRSLAIALEPFLPGLVAPPCEFVRYFLPTAKVDLARRLPIECSMWQDFVMFANVPTDEPSQGAGPSLPRTRAILSVHARPREAVRAWHSSREAGASRADSPRCGGEPFSGGAVCSVSARVVLGWRSDPAGHPRLRCPGATRRLPRGPAGSTTSPLKEAFGARGTGGDSDCGRSPP